MPDVDSKKAKPARSQYFWLPVLIAISVAVCAFSIGVTLWLTKASLGELHNLTRQAMRDRGDAIELAGNMLLSERLNFALYRDLLNEVLTGDDEKARAAAHRSVARVVASSLAASEDMKKEIALMTPQVFLITKSGASESEATRFEDALQRRENVRVLRETRNAAIKNTAVFCYEKTTCDQIGMTVVALLQEDGFVLEKPVPKDGASPIYAKRIDILLATSETDEKAEKKLEAPEKPKRPRR